MTAFSANGSPRLGVPVDHILDLLVNARSIGKKLIKAKSSYNIAHGCLADLIGDGANRSVTRGCAAKVLARRALMHCGRYLAHGRATNKKQPHLRGGCCISQALLDVAIATMAGALAPIIF